MILWCNFNKLISIFILSLHYLLQFINYKFIDFLLKSLMITLIFTFITIRLRDIITRISLVEM